jgi:threonine/homoserine/homoserine lactone efflux protein
MTLLDSRIASQVSSCHCIRDGEFAMPTATTFTVFAASALVLLLIPGPVVMYTLARSISQGRSAGLVSVLAAGLGDFCHVLAATVGLSAILMTSATAFNVVRYAGAAYLVYIGVRTLLAKESKEDATSVQATSLKRVFSQGVVVSVLNPKTALFFLAFLPQFVDPARGAAWLQILTLGVLFVTMGIITNSIYALVSSAASTWLKANRGFQRWQKYVAGGTYVALGVAAAFAGGEKTG